MTELKKQKEICRYSEIKIYTGNSKNLEDRIFNQTLFQFIKGNLVTLNFILAGVEYKEFNLVPSSVKSFKIEEETTDKSNMFIVLKGWFKLEDSEYVKYIRYCKTNYIKEVKSTKISGEITHKMFFETKIQVVVQSTTKETETENHAELWFGDKN